MDKTVLINTLVRLQQTIEIMTINRDFFFFIMLAKKMMEIADRFFFHGKKYVCSDCFSQFYQEIRSCKDVHKNKPQSDYLLSFQTSSYNKLYRYAKCMWRIKM